MNEEEKKAICELKNYISRRKLKYTKLDRHDKSIYNLLNLLEKLQKENEELKQDRNNNYQMIALAQNEMLGYIQGYEDGQKLKRSATACVVENQQYYIIRKKIEYYKEYIVKLQKENEELKSENRRLKVIRYSTEYGTENIHLITKSDLVEINTNKYFIEIQDGKFVDLKQVYQQNKELKQDYYNLINKIENKIDRFDYEFEKAKRQNDKDKSDYYWDLIRNVKKLLGGE